MLELTCSTNVGFWNCCSFCNLYTCTLYGIGIAATEPAAQLLQYQFHSSSIWPLVWAEQGHKVAADLSVVCTFQLLHFKQTLWFRVREIWIKGRKGKKLLFYFCLTCLSQVFMSCFLKTFKIGNSPLRLTIYSVQGAGGFWKPRCSGCYTHPKWVWNYDQRQKNLQTLLQDMRTARITTCKQSYCLSSNTS